APGLTRSRWDAGAEPHAAAAPDRPRPVLTALPMLPALAATARLAWPRRPAGRRRPAPATPHDPARRPDRGNGLAMGPGRRGAPPPKATTSILDPLQLGPSRPTLRPGAPRLPRHGPTPPPQPPRRHLAATGPSAKPSSARPPASSPPRSRRTDRHPG